MQITKESVQKLAGEYYEDIRSIRRHLHKNPELSFEEHNTSVFIKKKLDEYQIPYRDGYVKTGIIGIIEGANPKKKVIALRADIDALPIVEANEHEYASRKKGVMHACGHDVHTSSLLGASRILSNLRNEFEGTVLLIFQPAEEKLPGGARLMMEAGALSDPRPEIVIGQHVMPGLEQGKLGFRPGMYMASTDEIYLTIRGKGGHAAMPHQITDTVLITSHIIVSLQQIVSRHAQASIPSVLSFGKVIAEGATNVIPPEVKVEGTFRTMDEEWRVKAHDLIRRIAGSIAEGMGGSCDINIAGGYPFLVNHEDTTVKAMQFAREYLGDSNVVDLEIRMTAEDFAYYSQEFPSTFYRLGTTAPNGEYANPLHSPHFDVDEQALITGAGSMAWLAIRFLQEG